MSGTEVVSSPAASYGYYTNRPSIKHSPVRRKNFYILASESSQDSDSDGSDSVLSIQGKETDLAKDTSDTDWSYDDTEQVIEFDIVSSAEEKTEDFSSQVIDGDGSSDSDGPTASVFQIAMLNENDFMSADSENSSTIISSDSEKIIPGYSKCAQCKNVNNNPMFRYCEKCYKIRKDFFPPRPKRKKRRSNCPTKNKKVKLLPFESMGDISDLQSQSTELLDFKDILVPPSLRTDSQETAIKSSGDESAKSGSTSSSDLDGVCMVCLKEPKSGVFVHGSIAHICCCYKCSLRVWDKTKRCPICNCKVSNVLRAFIM